VETLQVREAKASFSAVVSAAERGQPTIISRHGQPCAMVVSITDGHKLYPPDQPSLALHLLSLPEPIEFERDATPLRSAEL
jgi:prevent-host-death family protein